MRKRKKANNGFDPSKMPPMPEVKPAKEEQRDQKIFELTPEQKAALAFAMNPDAVHDVRMRAEAALIAALDVFEDACGAVRENICRIVDEIENGGDEQ